MKIKKSQFIKIIKEEVRKNLQEMSVEDSPETIWRKYQNLLYLLNDFLQPEYKKAKLEAEIRDDIENEHDYRYKFLSNLARENIEAAAEFADKLSDDPILNGIPKDSILNPHNKSVYELVDYADELDRIYDF